MPPPDTDYLSAEQTRDRLVALANEPRNQPFCSIVNLVPTARGTPVNCLRIARMTEPTGKVFLAIGGIHAREWVPPTAIVRLAEKILDAYHTAGCGLQFGNLSYDHSAIVEIVENIVMYFMPMTNPDGYTYSRTFVAAGTDWKLKFPHINWRKNRPADPPAGQDDLCTGADLNRNFNICWDKRWYLHDSDADSSTVACDEPYIGPTAASEIETQNIQHMIDTHNIHYFLDCHMRGGFIFYPWALETVQTEHENQSFHLHNPLAAGAPRGPLDGSSPGFAQYMEPRNRRTFEMVSEHMREAIQRATGVQFTRQAVSQFTITGGSSIDYAYSRHILDPTKLPVYALAVEIGHGEIVPEHDTPDPAGPNLPGGFWPVFGGTEYNLDERELQAAIVSFLSFIHRGRGACAIYLMLAGAALAPLLQFLVEMRDVAFRETAFGRRFIDRLLACYRVVSPPVAAFLQRHAAVRGAASRALLQPAVRLLRGIHRLSSRLPTPRLRVAALAASVVLIALLPALAALTAVLLLAG